MNLPSRYTGPAWPLEGQQMPAKILDRGACAYNVAEQSVRVPDSCTEKGLGCLEHLLAYALGRRHKKSHIVLKGKPLL